MELGHWVTGSMGHLGHLSRLGQRVTGSSFWPGVRPEFFRFRKNAQNAKRTFEMLKWQKTLSCVCCWTEITELLLLPMIIKNSLAWEYFFTHKSTFRVQYRTGSPGRLGLRVAGFPGHWVAGSQNVTQFHLWRVATTVLKDEESARDNHVLAQRSIEINDVAMTTRLCRVE